MKLFKETLTRVVLVTVSILVSLLLLEGLVRIFMPQQLVIIRPDIWGPDERYGWNRAPNIHTRINTGERSVQLITDEYGHRIGSIPPPADPAYRVLALGDSFTEGLQVEQEDTMVGQLEQMLSEEFGEPVVVVNSGVAGWGPGQYLLKAQEELERQQYDLVLVFLFLGNDIITQRTEEFQPKTPETRHHLHIPQELSARELIDSTLYPINDYLEERSHLFILLRNTFPGIKATLVRLRHAEKYEGANLREQRQETFLEDVTYISQVESPRWEVTADICADIAATAALYDVPVIFVLLPAQSWVDEDIHQSVIKQNRLDPNAFDVDRPGRILSSELTARGLQVVNTKYAFDQAQAGGELHLFGRADTHFSPEGHILVATTIFNDVFLTLIENRPRS